MKSLKNLNIDGILSELMIQKSEVQETLFYKNYDHHKRNQI